jgi:hypothetical protein
MLDIEAVWKERLHDYDAQNKADLSDIKVCSVTLAVLNFRKMCRFVTCISLYLNIKSPKKDWVVPSRKKTERNSKK